MKKWERILYGGDYNPNQWPRDVWKEDMRLFKKANINSATVNVFSWAKLRDRVGYFYRSPAGLDGQALPGGFPNGLPRHAP